MNQSIEHLMLFVNLYKDYIIKIQSKYGEDAFCNSKYPISEIYELLKEFMKIDPIASTEDSFWGSIIEIDKENVLDELKNNN